MKSLFSLWLGFALLPSLFAAESEWLTSYPDALAKAKAENKVVMLDFTGSDWCGWCIKLKNEVFDQPEFIAFAQENLVMVEVDFPRRKPMSAEQIAANDKLETEFGVKGYPTLHFVDKNGARLHQGGYVRGGPKAFIAEVIKVTGHAWKIPGAEPAGGQTSTPDAKVDDSSKTRPKDIFQPPPPAKIRYDDLVLKGISGAKAKRMALINNQTFMVGESAEVKWGESKVRLSCLEIRDDSALVLVEGEKEPKELKLRLAAPKK